MSHHQLNIFNSRVIYYGPDTICGDIPADQRPSSSP